MLLIMTTGHCSLGGLPPAGWCVARSGEGGGAELSCPGVKVAYVEVAGWLVAVTSAQSCPSQHCTNMKAILITLVLGQVWSQGE